MIVTIADIPSDKLKMVNLEQSLMNILSNVLPGVMAMHIRLRLHPQFSSFFLVVEDPSHGPTESVFVQMGPFVFPAVGG